MEDTNENERANDLNLQSQQEHQEQSYGQNHNSELQSMVDTSVGIGNPMGIVVGGSSDLMPVEENVSLQNDSYQSVLVYETSEAVQLQSQSVEQLNNTTPTNTTMNPPLSWSHSNNSDNGSAVIDSSVNIIVKEQNQDNRNDEWLSMLEGASENQGAEQEEEIKMDGGSSGSIEEISYSREMDHGATVANPVPTVAEGHDEVMEYCEQESANVYTTPDSKYSFSPSSPMQCISTASTPFTAQGGGNFLKGCKWSPDGSQVLSCSNDNILRTFNPSIAETGGGTEMSPTCVMKENGLVYDYCWFPGTIDSTPQSNRIACSCPGSPIHLWDSNLREIVSCYKAFDHCDELISAYSVCFSPDGAKVYGGFKNAIRIYDTEYAHRKCTTINTYDKKSKEGQKGIISCMCHGPPGSNVFATGSYNKQVAIYYSLTNELLYLIQGQQGGVTHLRISPDGTKMYTGGRKDPEIVCWDLRNTGQILCTFLRDVQTNQRIYFDLSGGGRYLVSGNHDGSVQVWDTQHAGQEVNGEVIMKPCYTFQAHLDCTNGVSFNPISPLLATGCGQRHFDQSAAYSSDSDSSEDSGMSGETDRVEASLKIWSIPSVL